MINQELINYIKLQRQQGVSEETIKRNLLNSNWSEQDIGQALLQTGALQSTQSQTSVPPFSTQSSQTQVFTQQIDSSFTGEEEKPKMIKTISTLFFLIAILYIMSTVSMAGIIVIMDRAMSGGDLVFSFLKYFPTFGFIPILFSFITVLFFFAALKIRNGSKFSFWLGVTTLLVVPLSAAFLSQMLMSPFLNLVASSKGGMSESISTLPNPANLRFGDPIFILSFVALVLFLVSFNKFHFVNEPLSKKGKIFLTLLFFILVLPTCLVVSLGYIQANDTNYGFDKAKSKVSYRIYKPTFIPGNRVYGTRFNTGEELAGRNDAVGVRFGPSFEDIIQKGNNAVGVIQLKQVGIDDQFDFNSFLSKGFSTPLKTVSLSVAKEGKGYYTEAKTFNFLSFVTPDKTLIMITATKSSEDELIQFAESLQ